MPAEQTSGVRSRPLNSTTARGTRYDPIDVLPPDAKLCVCAWILPTRGAILGQLALAGCLVLVPFLYSDEH